jgi:hypothetical protein
MPAHQNCTHPATKAARAKCRRENKPATTPRIVTDADEVKSLQDEVEAAKADLIGKRVTPQNWRDFRGMKVEIELGVWGSQPNHRVIGEIKAWGTQYMSYLVPFYGKVNRVRTDRVLGAVCVK